MTLEARIAATDARVAETGARTLAPDRARATPILALTHAARPSLRAALGEALCVVVHAQLEAFPQNIFWDLDALASSVVAQARRSPEPHAHLRETAEIIARLQALFGCHSPVRFRYAHDFVYGFDWAKWVSRDPSRAHVGPYDRAFLEYTERRGHELLALIDEDDEKYPKLADGDPRNPFGFSREPQDEARLFESLASQDLLPVRAWEARPAPRWDRPFHALREQVASAGFALI